MFAERLKEARKAKRYSQAEVSRMLGVTQQAVGKWETGRSTPDPQTVARLAEILDTPTDVLLGLRKESGAASAVGRNAVSRYTESQIPVVGTVRAGCKASAWQSSSAWESCLSGHSISLPARARQRPAAAARRSRGRCLTPRRSAWGCSSFRWTILYPRPCPTLPRLCKGWRRAAWRRTWPPGRCGRRHCNVLRSACDRHSLLL